MSKFFRVVFDETTFLRHLMYSPIYVNCSTRCDVHTSLVLQKLITMIQRLLVGDRQFDRRILKLTMNSFGYKVFLCSPLSASHSAKWNHNNSLTRSILRA